MPIPLREREAKALRDEVSAAQFYYVQRGGMSSIPKGLKELSSRANILYQNTANENRPAGKPAPSLPPELKKGVCDNVPIGMKDFYLAYCI